MIRLLLAAFALILPVVCPGQTTPGTPPEALTPDSRVWRPILEFVVARVAGDILRGAQASAEEPWAITLPDSSPPWLQLRAHLVRVLRARDVRPGDASYRELHIGRLRINGDTARVQLRTGFTGKCPGSARITGYGNEEEILLLRFPGNVWGGRATSQGVRHGDRASCS